MGILVKDNYLHFDCGCRFKITNHKPLRLELNPESDSTDKLKINSNIYVGNGLYVYIGAIPLDCERTWDLISEGNTKGIFQLETRFGQISAKKLRPRNIEHLAALGAILRPGCLETKRDGKSVTDHYIDRKNGLEEVDYVHPSLEPILQSTYGEMIYQEQAMQIAQTIAGFNLQQADILRKAIGKKKADIMAAVKKEFVDGCNNVGLVSKEEAEIIFDGIEHSQRYSFNKSHSVAYAVHGYISAYLKAHFKESFFASWLYFAKDKQKPFDEIKLLVNVAKVMGVQVLPPDFRMNNLYFKREKNTVHFGFCNIKGIGEASMSKVRQAIFSAESALNKLRAEWNWLECLIYFSQSVSEPIIMGLIESGALDYLGVSRTRMAYEYNMYSTLTDKERAWFKKLNNIKQIIERNNSSLLDILIHGYAISNIYTNATTKDKKNLDKGPCANKNRVKVLSDLINMIKHPPRSMEDTSLWISRIEEAKLGIALTASIVDDCKDSSYANCTCEDFRKHKEISSGIFIAAQIDEVKITHTVNGRNPGSEMAFIEFSDSTSSLNGVIFSDVWEGIKMSGVCVPENTVMICGERGRERDSFIVKKISQLS